jgi:hypothetical protein
MCFTCLLLYTPHPVITPAVLDAFDAINATGTTPEQRREHALHPISRIECRSRSDRDLMNRSHHDPRWEWAILMPSPRSPRPSASWSPCSQGMCEEWRLRPDIAERAVSAPRRLLTSFGKSRSNARQPH